MRTIKYKYTTIVCVLLFFVGSLRAYNIPWSGKGAHQFNADDNELIDTNPAAFNTLLDRVQELGITSTTMNIDIGGIMPANVPSSDRAVFNYAGQEFSYSFSTYSRITRVAAALAARNVSVILVVLNGKSSAPDTYYPGVLDVLNELRQDPAHTHITNWKPIFCAFNVIDGSPGRKRFEAFLDLLARSQISGKFVIGNEIQNFDAWNYFGPDMPKTLAAVGSEYAKTLRVANTVLKNVNSSYRVFSSFDRHWTAGGQIQGREVLTHLRSVIPDFDWGVAWHPYTPSLNQTHFDNRLDMDASVVDLKNIEVLYFYLNRPENLFNGTARRVLFSEQGFSSTDTVQLAAAYAFYYTKAAAAPVGDSLNWLWITDRPALQAEWGLGSTGFMQEIPGLGKKAAIYEVAQTSGTPGWEGQYNNPAYDLKGKLGIRSWTDLYPSVVRNVPAPTGVVNISHRALVKPSSPIIGGFIISTDQPKRVLIRGVGKGLAPFLPNSLGDAQIVLYNSSGSIIASNDDWGSQTNAPTIQEVSSAVGAFPIHSTDSALLVSLSSGSYTLHVAGKGGLPGVALFELYDVDNMNGTSTSSRLINVSANAYADSSNPGILSTIISGAGSKSLLLRAIGPGLGQFGVNDYASNPRIDWGNSVTGHTFRSNDDWQTNNLNLYQTSEYSLTTGAFPVPSGSKDASVFVRVFPGSYSMVVQTSGIGGRVLAEMYVAE